ncbi:MAG: amidophosphoribosyltransferase, partial [Bacillota bacterium]|nr:amidophosphoribosyltransferase [Bacillota bacterium]
IRPLALGRLGETYLLSSETCAFNNLGARLEREVGPGELVVIDERGVRSWQAVPPETPALCVFEFIYFARPDSQLAGRNVHQVREAIGAALAAERPPRADAVIAAPDSGTSAAMGFARASGLPFEIGLIKNRYIGRTFIQPSQARRELGVRIKLSPVEPVIRGKRIVLIDDSIVRGTTSAKTVNLLREAGAAEVHMYVASPPYRYPCYYGIDTSQSGELIAARHSEEEIRKRIGADSLTYLSPEGLVRAVGLAREHLCLACFTGHYPVALAEERPEKFIFEG